MWSSFDGVTWSIVAETTSIGQQSLVSIAFDSQMYLYMFGGQTNLPINYQLVYYGARSTAPLSISAPTSDAAPAATASALVALVAFTLALTALAL